MCSDRMGVFHQERLERKGNKKKGCKMIRQWSKDGQKRWRIDDGVVSACVDVFVVFVISMYSYLLYLEFSCIRRPRTG